MKVTHIMKSCINFGKNLRELDWISRILINFSWSRSRYPRPDTFNPIVNLYLLRNQKKVLKPPQKNPNTVLFIFQLLASNLPQLWKIGVLKKNPLFKTFSSLRNLRISASTFPLKICHRTQLQDIRNPICNQTYEIWNSHHHHYASKSNWTAIKGFWRKEKEAKV